jgi:TrmH family RNA methyltransferase
MSKGDRPEVVDSIKHPVVAAARASTLESGTSFLVEGRKLVLEVLAAGAPLERVFFRHPLSDREVWEAARRARVECIVVTPAVFTKILGLKYEPATRLAGTVRIVRHSLRELVDGLTAESRLLVAESIQDPRNAGILIRTAEAWGVRAAIFTEGSANPFSRASVRSTTGSILRIAVTTGCQLAAVAVALRERGVRVIGASAAGGSVCWEVDLSPPCAFLLGNEASGLSPSARELSDLLVRIPMYGGAHSFNVTVAAGILLYEAARQRACREEAEAPVSICLREGLKSSS